MLSVLLAFASGSTWAAECADALRAIEAALPEHTNLSAKSRRQIEEQVNEGLRQHVLAEHGKAMRVQGKAMKTPELR